MAEADLEIDTDAIQRRMDGAMNALKTEFASLRTGRASASIVEPIMVEAYGQMTRSTSWAPSTCQSRAWW